MGRKPGYTTPAIARSARENQKKSVGVSGRKSTAMPKDVYKLLGGGPPIDDPFALARWYQRALALVTDMRLRGVRNVDKLAKEIRQNATAAGKVLPTDIILAAKRALNDDEERLSVDVGPEEETRAADDDSVRGVH